jgi:hypothetical protein
VSDARNAIRDELRDLVVEGTLIAGMEAADSAQHFGELLRTTLGRPEEDGKGAGRQKAKSPEDLSRQERGSAMLKRITGQRFGVVYQAWYTRSLRVVDQVLPDRREEFVGLYRPERPPKTLDPSTYSISDYMNGIVVTRGSAGEPVFDAKVIALTKLDTQVNILASAQPRLESALVDIQGVVEATLLDDELDVAKELHRSKHLRAAGVVAGVVLERHLKRVVEAHQITFRKKAQIGSLNDALKDGGVYAVVQWRQVQRLADIRNLCGHAGDRDPTSEEVTDLIDGVAKIVTTVF